MTTLAERQKQAQEVYARRKAEFDRLVADLTDMAATGCAASLGQPSMGDCANLGWWNSRLRDVVDGFYGRGRYAIEQPS